MVVERSFRERWKADSRPQNPDVASRRPGLGGLVPGAREIVEMTREVLQAHRAELAVDDLGRAAFMVVHLIDALTQAAILEKPEYLADDRYTVDIAEVLMKYLRA
jgi:hypothetical protein